MQQILAYAILAIGGVFVGLTLLIVLNKAWRETRQRRARRRRAVLEPQVLAYAHGDGASLAEALEGGIEEDDRSVLEWILLDHAQRVRGIEHERLARALAELSFTGRQLEALNSRRWWRRAEAAEKLGLAGAREAIDPLARTLRDDVPEVRMRAAKSLGLLGGTSSIRELIRALDEPDRWSSIRIADILTGLGPKMVDELVAAFPDLSREGKLAALDILGRVRPVQLAPWLVERLDDPADDVRARACHALGCLGDPETGARLVEALADPAWPVRAMAAKGLGRIRSVGSIPALCAALRDDEWWVRANAAAALREMGARGVEALERMLADEDRYARHQAVLMLEQAGVVDQHAAHLVSPAETERTLARSFVQLLVEAGQVRRLRSLAAEHPSGDVRQALVSLLPPAGPREAAP